jgi:hypothetical protein
MDKTVPLPAAFLLGFIGSKEAPKRLRYRLRQQHDGDPEATDLHDHEGDSGSGALAHQSLQVVRLRPVAVYGRQPPEHRKRCSDHTLRPHV